MNSVNKTLYIGSDIIKLTTEYEHSAYPAYIDYVDSKRYTYSRIDTTKKFA